MPNTLTSLAALSVATLLSVSTTAATVATACLPGSTVGKVTLRTLDTAVPNRCGADGVSVDDRIADESPWGNQAAFLSHVTSVTLALQRSGQLKPTERARLLIAARQSAIGSTLTVKLHLQRLSRHHQGR